MASNTVPHVSVAQSKQSWWVSLMILCAILGALIGLSVKSRDTIVKEGLPAQNFPGLTVAYNILKEKNADDERQIDTLNRHLTDLENGTSSTSRKDRALLADLDQAKMAACLTAVSGPGIVVALNDSKKAYPANLQIPGQAPPNLIHDTDINMIVNELKAAGAEALAVNDQRLYATSPIRCAGPTVFVNQIPQVPPYKIRAIGNPNTLVQAINLPGGVGDQMRQFDPAMISVQPVTHMVLPASPGPPPPQYAKPALDTAPSGQ